MTGVKCHETDWFAPLLKSDGSSLYLARDLATIFKRHEKYQFDRMLYVTGASQSFHFKQLFTILKMMKAPFADACEHIAFGSVAGMSSRKGNVILLRDMISQAREISLERLHSKFVTVDRDVPETMTESEVAKRVSVAGITIQDGKGRRLKDYSFDWNRVLDITGDTGAFILYTHTRLVSVRRKNADLLYPRAFSQVSLSPLLPEECAQTLCLILLRYPQIIHNSCSQLLDPSPLVNYLFELCRMIVKALAVLPIKSEPNLELRLARAALFYRCELILDDALSLLNIQPVPYM
jgi:arginyl-tRNA synthetase